MLKVEALQQSVDLISTPVAAEVSTHATTKPAGSMAAQFETLLLSTEDNITTICLNRPQKKNAISVMMYSEIIEALRLAGKDESIITVITGSGDYYCSGNDLTNFVTTKVTRSRVEQTDEEFLSMFRDFVRAFIDFPKPLIAVVNGPAVGVAVTLLGLFDTVYATDRATFHTPFTKLGMFPEGCSSYTFPRMMGAAKASEMLLFGRKLSAAEAREQGLVTDVFPDSTFQAEVWRRLKAYAQLPRNSLVLSKQLMRSHYREKLHAVNDRECEVVAGLQQSEECMNAVVSFLQSKSKL
ncbi:hypothetical protein AGOR_G00042530 [Albula goreensis]|uniref:Enoyl-CoA delta isomerase 2, mitochondrial n=1 Tax=Albula goreensis TaxID=1534307 RepID=A0A8T3E1V4_9TELE|nr:hypothetical protein AGOR_G00042530 [Albula goreensis]